MGWEAYFEEVFEKVTKAKMDEMKKEYQGESDPHLFSPSFYLSSLQPDSTGLDSSLLSFSLPKLTSLFPPSLHPLPTSHHPQDPPKNSQTSSPPTSPTPVPSPSS